MGLDSLLIRLEARTPGTSEKTDDVLAKPVSIVGSTPRTPGTPEKDVSVNKIENGESAHSEKFGIPKVGAQSSQDEQLRELAMKARRQKILTMLDENPGVPRAVHTDTQNDPDNVILTIAIRDLATFEMLIPKARYEPWQFMTMLDKAGGLH